MTDTTRIACKPWEHSFVPKKQSTSPSTIDISEVYCQKCGTVCILEVLRKAVAYLERHKN
jgi:hypothetical protein